MCRPGRLTTRKRPNLSTIAELCCLTIKSPENKTNAMISETNNAIIMIYFFLCNRLMLKLYLKIWFLLIL